MRITPAALTNSGAIKRQKEYCWPLIWVSSREPEYFYILSHFISCFIHIIIPTCCKNSVLFFGHETDGQVTSLDVLCLWWKTGLNSMRKMFDRFSVFTKKKKEKWGTTYHEHLFIRFVRKCSLRQSSEPVAGDHCK